MLTNFHFQTTALIHCSRYTLPHSRVPNKHNWLQMESGSVQSNLQGGNEMKGCDKDFVQKRGTDTFCFIWINFPCDPEISGPQVILYGPVDHTNRAEWFPLRQMSTEIMFHLLPKLELNAYPYILNTFESASSKISVIKKEFCARRLHL